MSKLIRNFEYPNQMTPKTAFTMIDNTIREYLLAEQLNAAVRAGA